MIINNNHTALDLKNRGQYINAIDYCHKGLQMPKHHEFMMLWANA